MQPVPSIKSRPVYEDIGIDPAVQKHLFIAQTGSFDKLAKIYQACPSDKSCWIVGDDTQESLPDNSRFVSQDGIDTVFGEQFADLPISSHIYVAGQNESFLWDIHNLATRAGLASEQVKMFEPVTNQRRLFCTHCYTLTEGVTHSPYECPGCGRLLLVRDHFSRIHAAYVGVIINAEDPNDIPEIEELS